MSEIEKFADDLESGDLLTDHGRHVVTDVVIDGDDVLVYFTETDDEAPAVYDGSAIVTVAADEDD